MPPAIFTNGAGRSSPLSESYSRHDRFLQFLIQVIKSSPNARKIWVNGKSYGESIKFKEVFGPWQCLLGSDEKDKIWSGEVSACQSVSSCDLDGNLDGNPDGNLDGDIDGDQALKKGKRLCFNMTLNAKEIGGEELLVPFVQKHVVRNMSACFYSYM